MSSAHLIDERKRFGKDREASLLLYQLLMSLYITSSSWTVYNLNYWGHNWVVSENCRLRTSILVWFSTFMWCSQDLELLIWFSVGVREYQDRVPETLHFSFYRSTHSHLGARRWSEPEVAVTPSIIYQSLPPFPFKCSVRLHVQLPPRFDLMPSTDVCGEPRVSLKTELHHLAFGSVF